MSGFKGAFCCCSVGSISSLLALDFITRMIFTCVFSSESCLKLPCAYETGILGVGPGDVKYLTELEGAEEGVGRIPSCPAGTDRNISRLSWSRLTVPALVQHCQ